MFTDLLHSSYFSLFLIVALGFMLGRVKIKGLSLDVSAVIFIALLFGHFGVIIPKELGNFGLVLFIFTIGIQAGPGFFDSFRSKGKTLILITMLIICSACLTAVGLKYAFDIDTPSVVGLIAGALTSTPGLAVAIDSTHSPLASIAYGIAYPFGVIGVILFVKLLPKIMRVDLDKEARRLEIERRGQFPELITCIYRITNSNVFNRSLMQINARGMTGAVISRLKHSDEISIPTASTVLHEGDYIQAVGSEESLNQLAVLVGEREEGELPLDKTQEIESLLLTKKDMINKQLGDLNLQKNFGCTVTRIRRSGIDLSPSPDLALKFGDKLMVVGEKEGLKGIARLLGNNAKKLSDTDFFPIAMGIVLGVLFGKINISFSESLSFSPGLTGGVLMVALVLSAEDSLKIANEQMASSEFATLLEVEKLNAEKKELMLQAQEKEIRNKTTLIISLIVLLGILFMFLYRENFLKRKLKVSESELKIRNEELTISREELHKAKDIAEASSRMKTTFIESMTHEIRTPLNSIVGFSQILNDHYSNSPETQEFVKIIENNSNDLLRLVTDVLALSELDQYDKLPTNITTNVNAICELAYEVAKNKSQKGVEVFFKPERESLFILSNQERISQVLNNLMHNAAKFTSHGSICIAYSISEAEKKIEISVTDTGMGIPADKQNCVFERFYKVNSFTQGTGLGLSISRSIAEKLGGSLQIDSSYTDGCRIVLTLPLVYA